MVMLINADGVKAGVVPLDLALRVAAEAGLDLVEMGTGEQGVPIVKIMDYSKLRYQEHQREKKARRQAKAQEVKEIRIRAVTEEHDLETKRKQVIKFLQKGEPVRITLRLRGRERSNKQYAVDAINKFVDSVSKYGKRSGRQSINGDTIIVNIAPITGMNA